MVSQIASLHFIFAPMNAGKSAQLLMVLHQYELQNRKVLLIKPLLDTRNSRFIKSRALEVKREADLLLDKKDNGVVFKTVHDFGYDVVLLDEAQFLTREQVDELGDVVDMLDIPVMAYGLRVDFNGNMFDGSKRLFEIADKFQEFKTMCPCCGAKAIINMRVDSAGKPIFNGEQIEPGTHYVPVCRQYYKELRNEFKG